jgi:hypothetical protein
MPDDYKSNGCGTDGWSAKLIPNTIYGLDIKECCKYHDFLYSATNKSFALKQQADRIFLNNLIRKINADTKWWRNNFFIKKLMRSRAYKYYKAVDMFGASAYWDGK